MVGPLAARPRWQARPVLVLLHRWAGLGMALFLILAGLSGSVLAFKDDLDAWLNPDLFQRTPGASQPIDALVAAVERADEAARVVSVSYPTAQVGTAMLGVAAQRGTLDYDQVFVDPASGRVLGRRDSQRCCFSARQLMPFVFRFHYTLAGGQIGQWFMGGVALVWTLDCFVGLWLTLPRLRPFLARWRAAWKIKATRNVFRLTLDLHRAGGLWCWALLLVMAVSGVALTLSAEVFQPAVSALLPTSPRLEDQARTLPPMTGAPAVSFGEAAALAQAGRTGDPVFSYYLPAIGVYGVALQLPGHGAESGLGPDWIYIDSRGGAVLRADVAGQGRAGDLVLQAQYPLHSGQIIGLAGRVIVCVLGVVVALLAATGVYVWWRKRRARLVAGAAREALALCRG